MQESDLILEGADHDDVAFLVVGDPFGCVLCEPNQHLGVLDLGGDMLHRYHPTHVILQVVAAVGNLPVGS